MSQTEPPKPAGVAVPPKSIWRDPVIIAALIGLAGVIITAIVAPLLLEWVKTTPTPPAATAAPAPSESARPGYVCPNNLACIKANISQGTGEKLYHFPGCSYYDDTIITAANGERYFVTAAEAEAAGWVKARGCP